MISVKYLIFAILIFLDTVRAQISNKTLLPLTLDECLVKLGDLAGKRKQDCTCHVSELQVYGLKDGTSCQKGDDEFNYEGICLNQECHDSCPLIGPIVDVCPEGTINGANGGGEGFCSWLACQCYDRSKNFQVVASIKNGVEVTPYNYGSPKGICQERIVTHE